MVQEIQYDFGYPEYSLEEMVKDFRSIVIAANFNNAKKLLIDYHQPRKLINFRLVKKVNLSKETFLRSIL